MHCHMWEYKCANPTFPVKVLSLCSSWQLTNYCSFTEEVRLLQDADHVIQTIWWQMGLFFFAVEYTVYLTDVNIKSAVSLVVICNQRTSHLCLASFPLSHSTPDLAADTSFSARCTRFTLEKIFLLWTLPSDWLLFVFCAAQIRMKEAGHISEYLSASARVSSCSSCTFCSSPCHTFTKQRWKIECRVFGCWIIHQLTQQKSEPRACFRVVPLLFYKPRLPRTEIQLLSIDHHVAAICSIM